MSNSRCDIARQATSWSAAWPCCTFSARPVRLKTGLVAYRTIRSALERKEVGLRIAVMGSGGVGGYFGARLAKGGADVVFIARGPHLEAMRKHGLRIENDLDPIA